MAQLLKGTALFFILTLPALLFAQAPTISSLSPTSGPVGTSVTITGTNFGTTQGTSTVTFNGTTATPTSWSATSIVASVPSGATTGNVLVTVVGLTSNGVLFTVATPPTITSVTPTSGPIGRSVTIAGTNFGATQGTSTVTFNGTTATPTSWSATSIAAPVPAGTTNGSVVVSVGGLLSNGVGFTVTSGPGITALSPASGPAGTSVTITGNGFGATQGSSTVAFNGTSAAPASWSVTSIVAPVPAGATTGNVAVTVGGIASNPVSFVVSAAPIITSLSPTSGSTNTAVTISGSGFGSTVGTVNFTCISSPCPSNHLIGAHAASWNANSISVPVPNLATTGPVTVIAGGSTSNGVTFTVPSGGAISGTITRIVDGTAVYGALVTALQSGVTIESQTTPLNGSYTLPNLGPGTYDVQVSGNGYVTATRPGNTVSANTTTALNMSLGPAPLITSVSPGWGPVGTNVTISGSNFGVSQAASTVTFNTILSTPSSWTSSSIVAPVPSGATSGSLVVTVGGVASNSFSFSVGSGTVSGAVTSTANGSAISGALVELLQSNSVRASASTAANGSYSIPNLGPGGYDVRTSAAGFGSLLSLGKIVNVGATTTVNVSLPAPGTDSGTVTRASNGAAIPGVAITASQNSDTVGTTTTDSSGHFSMSNLSPGTYGITAVTPNYATQTQSSVTITANTTTTTNFSLTGQSTITYEYDALGRLVGVVDSQNGPAAYNYDSVGNITSIARPSTSQVAIISITPPSGPIGSTVTINGNNFSGTVSQDTVKFNGTTAVISSATSTQLIVAVPTGATTGTIVVTAPAGSATSNGPFTVTTANPPAITSFTPTVGLVGSSVSVVGSFNPILTNNSLTLNIGKALVGSSSTTTNLATSVPALRTTSGRFAVTTPSGNAVSTSDFYVVPAPHQVTDVGFTGRTLINATASLVPLSRNQIGLLLFDGTAGQRITLQATNNTYGCNLNWQILAPDGTTLISSSCLGGNSNPIGPLQLSQTGTYTLYLTAGTTGQVNIRISSALPDITAALYPGAPTVGPLSVTTAGQKYLLTFNGTAGRRISFLTSNGTFGNCGSGVTVFILNPDGTTLFPSSCFGSSGFSGAIPLSQTGTYLIQMTPNNNTTGSTSVTLYDVPADVTVTLPMNGTATVQTTVPGQRAFFSFSGTAAQNISLLFNNNPSACQWAASILNPNGSVLDSQLQGCPANLFFDKTNLGVTGTYSVPIIPDSHNPSFIGSWTATLYNVVDVTGSTTIGASPLGVNITTPGQNASITFPFSGPINTLATVHITTDTIAWATVTLLNPDGTTLTSASGTSAFNLPQKALPQTGTYTIYFNPQAADTGSLNVQVTSP